jgi:hypothetical protein
MNNVTGKYSIVLGKNGYCDTDYTFVIADGFSQIEIDKYGNITKNGGQYIANEEIIEILKGSMMYVLSSDEHPEIYVRNKKLKRILKKK